MSDSIRTVLQDVVAERSTALLSGTLVDETGAALGASSLTTFTFTLYNRSTEVVINSRTATSILNTGPGTVDSSGNWTLTLTPADNAIIGTDQSEWHVALLQWTYGVAGAKSGAHEVMYAVRNLAKVT